MHYSNGKYIYLYTRPNRHRPWVVGVRSQRTASSCSWCSQHQQQQSAMQRIASEPLFSLWLLPWTKISLNFSAFRFITMFSPAKLILFHVFMRFSLQLFHGWMCICFGALTADRHLFHFPISGFLHFFADAAARLHLCVCVDVSFVRRTNCGCSGL